MEAKKNEIFGLLAEDAWRENHLTENHIDNTIFYHKVCFNSAKSSHKSNTTKNDEINQQNMHSSQVFTEIKGRVQQTILIDNCVRSLAEVYEEYSNLFKEELTRHQIVDHAMVTPQQLLRKLLSTFSNLSKTVSGNRTFIHPSRMKIRSKKYFSQILFQSK